MGIQVRPLATAARLVSGAAGIRVQARRRLDMVLLVVVGFVVGGAAAIGAAVGDSERISGLWAGAVVASDGSARITEVIDYDFGILQRHGIYRDVPGLSPEAQVTVSSVTAPDEVELFSVGSGTQIRVGDPSRTISGRHRYRIQYPQDGVAPDGGLAWNAVGTQWPVGMGDVQVDVVAPFEFQGLSCVQGAAGSKAPCKVTQPEPGHLVARLSALRAGQGATLYATSGRQLEAAPPCRCRRLAGRRM